MHAEVAGRRHVVGRANLVAGLRRRLIDQAHLALDVDVRLDERHRLHGADLLHAGNDATFAVTRSWKLRSATGPGFRSHANICITIT